MGDIKQPRWFLLSLLVVVSDRISKSAYERFTPEDFRRTVIPGFFDLVHTHNPGVAFGMFSEAASPWIRIGLIAFSLIVIVAIGVMLARNHWAPARQNAGLALILGGAFGNLMDRVQSGAVLDFLDFYVGAHHWPAFNVADSCIVIGAGLVILDLLFERPPRQG
ncbi:MAG: signal peptidase II [Acidobacteria bacterium]|nr:signal peptidase II [Acidobacteriota bacterium]